MVEIYDTAVTDIISNKCIDEKKNQIDIQWSKLMCDQVPTPGRRHVADGWSMVRSQRWLIGYTFLHQQSYVVPTLGQPYHINPTVGLLTLAQRGANVGMPTATFDQPCRPCTNVGSTSCCWLGHNVGLMLCGLCNLSVDVVEIRCDVMLCGLFYLCLYLLR